MNAKDGGAGEAGDTGAAAAAAAGLNAKVRAGAGGGGGGRGGASEGANTGTGALGRPRTADDFLGTIMGGASSNSRLACAADDSRGTANRKDDAIFAPLPFTKAFFLASSSSSSSCFFFLWG